MRRTSERGDLSVAPKYWHRNWSFSSPQRHNLTNNYCHLSLWRLHGIPCRQTVKSSYFWWAKFTATASLQDIPAPSAISVGNYTTLTLPTGKTQTTRPSHIISHTTSVLLPSMDNKLKHHRKPRQQEQQLYELCVLLGIGTHQMCIERLFFSNLK
jgi:hypothetical protein